MAKKKDTEGFIVASEFRDRNNFDKTYFVGDDVSHLDESVIESLVTRGLVEAPSEEDAKTKAAAEKAQADADKKQAEEDAKTKAAAETK